MSDPDVEMFGRALEGALIEENKQLCIEVAALNDRVKNLTVALDDASERNGLLQHRIAERDQAALIAAAQFDAETSRAEDAHGEAQRWALEVERLSPYVEAFRREEKRADDGGRIIDDLRAEIERLHELAYAPDGKEYRSMVFDEAAKRLPLQEEVERLRTALQKAEEAEEFHQNCTECDGDGEGEPEACPECFPLADDARTMRWEALGLALTAGQSAGKQLARESKMDDEPFGRQPKPVQVIITGKEAADVVYWVRHIKRACEFKGDLVEQQGSTQLTIYPRAVND